VDTLGLQWRQVHSVAAQGGRRIEISSNGSYEQDLGRPQFLEAVQHQWRRAGKVLDDHALGPLQVLQVFDDLPAEVQIPHPRTTEPTDEGPARGSHSGAGHSSVQPQELISRLMTPLPVSM